MTEDEYTVKYPLPDEIIRFVSTLREKERLGVIEFAQTNAYLCALSEAGWTLRAIANAMNGLYVKAVQERISKGRTDPPEKPLVGPEIPESPTRIKRNREALSKSTRSEREAYRIPDDVSERMRLLQIDAREVRGTTPENSPLRISSMELTHLMKSEKDKGATFEELGRAAGVTWSAAKFRLGRSGLYKLPPSMTHTATEDLSGTAPPSTGKDNK